MSLVQDLITRNRKGEAVGLPCFCTANEHVLRAVLRFVADTGLTTVIEATCNQVNQDGGYTGMVPEDFIEWIKEMAGEAGVPMDQLILGGDHLGPNPWKSDAAPDAMEKARELVRLYVQAGFTKIHLDASMPCGGEEHPSFAQIAERAADLCAVAERHAPEPDKLIYIIGTEVPIPGGETEEPDALDVTSVSRFRETIDTHRAAWAERGLNTAWSRIVSVVTQPGVDFGHSTVYPFVPEKAAPLREAVLMEKGLSFEAHSTDYQSTEALSALVRNHFFFLKVGPELTFRFREAIWALSAVEEQLFGADVSRIRQVIMERMAARPEYWDAYYCGEPADVEILKAFSYSDRIRYYWSDPKVAQSLDLLIRTLDNAAIPPTILSQAFMGLEFGEMSEHPAELIEQHIQRCVRRYFRAAGADC